MTLTKTYKENRVFASDRISESKGEVETLVSPPITRVARSGMQRFLNKYGADYLKIK